jgi:hypothetical protein
LRLECKVFFFFVGLQLLLNLNVLSLAVLVAFLSLGPWLHFFKNLTCCLALDQLRLKGTLALVFLLSESDNRLPRLLTVISEYFWFGRRGVRKGLIAFHFEIYN